jgi:hypothetical protein
MIIFEVLDNEDWPIEELLFDDVYQGRESEIKIFRVVNTREEDIHKITIRAIESPTNQAGNIYDTVMAHLFSLNGLDFQREINFPLPVLGEKLIYTYYRPPSNTVPGDVEWAMELFSTPPSDVEILCE